MQRMEHELALPKLPKGEKFVPVLWSYEKETVPEVAVTEEAPAEKEAASGKTENKIVIPGRSIAVYISQKEKV